MVRMSDILKKKMQPHPSSQEAQSAEKVDDAGAVVSEPAIPKSQEQREAPEELQITKAMRQVQPDIEEIKFFYAKIIQTLQDLFKSLKDKEPFELKQINDLIKQAVDLIVLGDIILLGLAADDYSGDDYPFHHMANVMILSIRLGLELEYNKIRLNELGLAALLHDIGMVKYRDMVIESRTVSKEERDLIKQHAQEGAKALSLFENVKNEIIAAIKEHHERFKGSGYPDGIKNGNISEYARIIGTIDVYEALTHSRNYRPHKYSPHEAVKEMLTVNSQSFDPAILKTFINQVGIYPVGSWVELNTSEVARVIAPNANSPLRPIVAIIFDAHRNKLEEPRAVNLSKAFNVYIKKSLSDEEARKLIQK